MVEKNFAAVNFRLTYSGPFSFQDFLNFTDHWAYEHHYHKEIKDHAQHHQQRGQEIHYSIELWRHVNPQVVAIVRLTFLANKVKDVTISSRARKDRAQHGDLIVEIDGLLERHNIHAWENKPYIFFVRGIIDRFIHKTLFDVDAGPLASDVRNLYDRTRGFFQKDETRYLS